MNHQRMLCYNFFTLCFLLVIKCVLTDFQISYSIITAHDVFFKAALQTVCSKRKNYWSFFFSRSTRPVTVFTDLRVSGVKIIKLKSVSDCGDNTPTLCGLIVFLYWVEKFWDKNIKMQEVRYVFKTELK